ncbi:MULTISPECIES: nif-specific transcriptional activator NifA [Bradyrhizobium]|uniref:Nif-specific regulatory protein n=3 Tax=Bradyrhizobium TaxID=374 RepID=A0AAE5X8R9_9BRAD|nr:MULTISPECIES: nif-specific transcriptional activator NifA [Bradyrhizobium]MCG2632939.1 nif-specific transcriptional activator NifA [Bradyrhizobium zhengyangense]MCG2645545.1 nif-specific transcriptional activator NifA [Bradyrhizobium zhengyangense]MCG2673142.1 nif-specific transcriptional activator NifA [Bradyrhizobium zhengyangense]MDN4985669.1 nif-specific transcriptional activator NifA [Bradyrhizobium sp. WYCCWR 13022]MDN5006129.1 nif-specific transcriptional activator NifA [Bradyrhizobi
MTSDILSSTSQFKSPGAEASRSDAQWAHPKVPEILLRIAEQLAAPFRLELRLEAVVALIQSQLQMQHCVVCLHAGHNAPAIAVGAGWTEGSDQRFRLRLPQGAVERVLNTATPLIITPTQPNNSQTTSDSGSSDATAHSRLSFIAVPIAVESTTVGVLSAELFRDGSPSLDPNSHVTLLLAIANMLGHFLRSYLSTAHDDSEPPLATDGNQTTLPQDDQAEADRNLTLPGVVGRSPALRKLLRKINVVAKSNATILLRGESGSGKEVAAQAIHDLSPRANRPFVKLNCAALSETILESELFGHEKGAFTGAINSRKGRFELADKGTLFLDEIGEISPSFQAKLLRVLQQQEFERVGGTHTIRVDVRLIAATNKDLEVAVSQTQFRADLYYRLSVIPLLVPPLCERRDDIPLLATEFLRTFNSENERSLTFEPSAFDVLKSCEFPGNIRELHNCVQRTATMAAGPAINSRDFACKSDGCFSARLWKSKQPLSMPSQPLPHTGPCDASSEPAHGTTLSHLQVTRGERIIDREHLIAAMERAGWVQAKAARLLKLTSRQIGYALKKHGVELKHL